MKISRTNSQSVSGLNAPSGVSPAGADVASRQTQATNTPSDQVQISTLSRYLASALDGSPAQVAKVSELGAAISAGRYAVDAHAVSGSIIQHAIEFGGPTYLALNS